MESHTSNTDRKEQILDLARRRGRVMVDSLAEEFGVSAHTIRRDINALCEDAKLRRLHGGAEFVDERTNVPYSARAVLNLAAKRTIAEVVADLVPDRATVFLSIGTTPTLVAEALSAKDSLTVITNNLNAAMALSDNPSNRIILPGGELRLPDRDFLSEAAIDLFSDYRADFGIYGVGGIDHDGSLLDFHHPEVRAREEMRRNSRCSVLVADVSKFGRRAAAVGGRISDADRVVIDARPGEPYARLLDDLGDQLIVAGEREAAA